MSILSIFVGVILGLIALGSLYLFMRVLGIRRTVPDRKRFLIALAVFIIFLFIFVASSQASTSSGIRNTGG